VAIGVGFGMQTLFKNLISGLMILIEQPFHLGDLVEVGTIRGRVTDIGVRASVVRDTQGIETLIPNSSFLEQSVTNWTYNNMRVRFSVQVGVAYDADLRRVRELLEQVGGRHNLLIQEPPPFVLLDDFGPDALLVSLNFWLELRPEVDRLAVQSDLRFMIVQTFAKAGIAIAFPQRDVHLDTSHPLEIRMMAPSGRSGPASGGASARDMP
jgi:small-conductance mechanosensitive channel